jgi:hypothetical protein
MNFEEMFAKLKDYSELDIQGRREIIQLLLHNLEEDINILQRDKQALYDKFEELESLESSLNDESEDVNSLKTRYINISEDLRDLADIITSLEGIL